MEIHIDALSHFGKLYLNYGSKEKLYPEKDLIKISKDPYESFLFAKVVLKDRFPLGEFAISQNVDYSFEYSKMLGERFVLGERLIFKSQKYRQLYFKMFYKKTRDYVFFKEYEKEYLTDYGDYLNVKNLNQFYDYDGDISKINQIKIPILIAISKSNFAYEFTKEFMRKNIDIDAIVFDIFLPFINKFLKENNELNK